MVNLKSHFKASYYYQSLNATVEDAGFAGTTNSVQAPSNAGYHLDTMLEQQYIQWVEPTTVANISAVLVNLANSRSEDQHALSKMHTLSADMQK